MPRRKKSTKGRPLRWSVLAMNALLDLADWEDYWGGEAEARRAWKALKDTAPGRREYSAPFWAYEPGIPAELRSYDGLPDGDGYARSEWLDAHTEARRAWLAARA
jgi:hypothetical protein